MPVVQQLSLCHHLELTLGFENLDVFTPYGSTVGSKITSKDWILFLVIARQMIRKTGVKKSATGDNTQVKQAKNSTTKSQGQASLVKLARKTFSVSHCSWALKLWTCNDLKMYNLKSHFLNIAAVYAHNTMRRGKALSPASIVRRLMPEGEVSTYISHVAAIWYWLCMGVEWKSPNMLFNRTKFFSWPLVLC